MSLQASIWIHWKQTPYRLSGPSAIETIAMFIFKVPQTQLIESKAGKDVKVSSQLQAYELQVEVF